MLLQADREYAAEMAKREKQKAEFEAKALVTKRKLEEEDRRRAAAAAESERRKRLADERAERRRTRDAELVEMGAFRVKSEWDEEIAEVDALLREL